MINLMSDTPDPITALFNHDWAALGGWSLFFSLCLVIVIGSFRELWAPGARVKRLEALVEKQANVISSQSEQIDKLVATTDITKYFFEEMLPKNKQYPKRGEPDRDLV